MGRWLPSAPVWAVWFVATVPGPLVWFHASKPLESFPAAGSIHLWSVVALPVLTAFAARRAALGRPWGAAKVLRALAAALLTGAVSVAVSLAVFRWAVPLEAPAGRQLVQALPLALVGGVAGCVAGFRGGGAPGKYRYVAGGVLAFLGLVTGTAALETAARESVSARPAAAGDTAERTGVRLERGRAALHRYDAEDDARGCVVTGPGGSRLDVDPLTVPVSWSVDATADIWVADVHVPTTGDYLLTCPAPDAGIGQVRVRGLVSHLVGWPLPVLWLLGAAPGLIVVADTAARRRRGVAQLSAIFKQ